MNVIRRSLTCFFSQFSSKSIIAACHAHHVQVCYPHKILLSIYEYIHDFKFTEQSVTSLSMCVALLEMDLIELKNKICAL